MLSAPGIRPEQLELTQFAYKRPNGGGDLGVIDMAEDVYEEIVFTEHLLGRAALDLGEVDGA